MAEPNDYDCGPPPPPIPARTPSMFIEVQQQHQSFTLPRISRHSDDNPPPLPPRPDRASVGSSSTLGRPNRQQHGIESLQVNTSLPPPLPPKPTTIPRPIPRSMSTPVGLGTVERSHSSTVSPGVGAVELLLEQYDTVPVSLSDLTDNLQSKIPSCVKVREFRAVHNAPCTLAEGDILNLHFSKSTRVAYVQSISNMTLQVPVNSPMMCSVIYDPVDDMERAETGYTFGSGTQLMNASPLPFFVGVVKGCKATKTTSQFNDGEVLVVKGMHSNQRHLKCLTVPDQEVKFVHTTTTAVFTTNPVQIKVFLSEVVKHLEYQIKVKLYPQDPELQQHMRKPYTLLDIGAQKSVVATYGCFKPQLQNTGSDHILEIFLDSPLKCEAVELARSSERQDLLRKSKKIFQSFSPSCVNEIVVDIPSAVYACQTLLFLSVEQVHGASLQGKAPLVHNATLTGERPQHMPLPQPNNIQPINSRYTQRQPTAPVPAPRVMKQNEPLVSQSHDPLQRPAIRPPLIRDPIQLPTADTRQTFPTLNEEGYSYTYKLWTSYFILSLLFYI